MIHDGDPQEQQLKVKFEQPVKQVDIDQITAVLMSEKSYGVTSVTSDLNTQVMVIYLTAEPEMRRVVFEVFQKLGYRVTYTS